MLHCCAFAAGTANSAGAVGGVDEDGGMGSPLELFSPATREWFDGAFAAPTEVQAGAWQAIAGGAHALVVAPTGSGKTLAAFLWAIDRLAAAPSTLRSPPHGRPMLTHRSEPAAWARDQG